MAEPTELFEKPYAIVDAQIAAMADRADTALARANNIIDQLGTVDIADPPAPPEFNAADVGDVADIPAFNGQKPSPQLFGEVGDLTLPPDPGNGEDLIGDITFEDIEIPEFTPSVGQITIPQPPQPIAVGDLPASPMLTPVTIPDAPDIELPMIGQLKDIEIPEFEFPELPTFDAQAPTFTVAEPNVALDYQEPEYKSEDLDAVKRTVSRLLAGGTGLPPAVEEAIFNRSIERADQAATADIQTAFDTFAGRGWDMPPGMLNANVDAATEKRKEQIAQARRDVLIQASQYEIENLRTAVQQGLSLQQLLVNVFDNAAQRALRIAELRQQADLALYNAQVSLFNARQNAYQVQAQVFGQRLQAALSKLEVYRAQIAGQQAIGQINQQVVETYQAQVQAVRERVGIYTARMQGAELQSRVQSNEIDKYKAEVDAYGKLIDADKIRFDAYEAQVRGESAKAQITESESRAFAATVDAARSKSNIRVEQIRARLDAVGAATSRYLAKVQAERDFAAAQVSNIQARAAAYSADVGRYAAEVDADRSRNELQARIAQDKLRNALAFYDTQVREYDAILQRMIQQANVKNASITAAGQMASQLAAGAMSAVNVGASLSGSANQSVTETINRS